MNTKDELDQGEIAPFFLSGGRDSIPYELTLLISFNGKFYLNCWRDGVYRSRRKSDLSSEDPTSTRRPLPLDSLLSSRHRMFEG